MVLAALPLVFGMLGSLGSFGTQALEMCDLNLTVENFFFFFLTFNIFFNPSAGQLGDFNLLEINSWRAIFIFFVASKDACQQCNVQPLHHNELLSGI